MSNIIGVDLGGTTIGAALVTDKGKIIDKLEVPTQTNKGTKTIVNNIISAIKEIKKGEISGIGIGSPGPLDYKKGIIKDAVNLPFKNIPLKDIIQNKFKIKTYLDNDANCFGLAEAVFGQGKVYDNVVGITLGTGFGGSLIIKRKTYRGRNNAAELGHLTINHDGPDSRCNNHGCIETHVSARGIKRMHGASNPHLIEKLAKKGDEKAKKTYEETGHYLGLGLTNIMYALDPDIIIIGGKISNAWSLFSNTMNKVIKERYFVEPCNIVKSKLKNPGILGAAALVLEDK